MSWEQAEVSWSELGDGSELGASWSELGDGSELEQGKRAGASLEQAGVSCK